MMRNAYKLSEDGTSYKIYFLDGSFFMIDANDFPEVSKFSWSAGKRGYPIMHTSRKSEGGHKTMPLHRLLLTPDAGFDVDHISGDKMDNRRSNLRVCTHQQNMFNQKLRNTNTSGYYGVSRVKSTGLYEAYVHLGGKKHYLGTYPTAEEAASVRDKAVEKLFGEFARLNKNLEVERLCVN